MEYFSGKLTHGTTLYCVLSALYRVLSAILNYLNLGNCVVNEDLIRAYSSQCCDDVGKTEKVG